MKLYGACIATHNIEAMVGFYIKIFGYEPHIDGPDHRFLDAQLIIYSLEEMNAPSAKNVALVYVVDNVDVEFSRLKSLGIADNPPTDKPWGVRSFTINDPDGNVVSFFGNFLQHIKQKDFRPKYSNSTVEEWKGFSVLQKVRHDYEGSYLFYEPKIKVEKS